MMIERIFLSAIALLFVLPLPLKMVTNNHKQFHGVPLLSHPWLANQTLQGTTVAARDVAFSWSVLTDASFQKSKADRFGEGFPGREALIRWTSEVWFRVFREPASLTSTIAIGPRGELFEKSALQAYFLQRTERNEIEPWVKKLRRLQEYCREHGQGFAVLITPSKPALYPEKTPLAWRRDFAPQPRGYVHLVELLRESGIFFVDAPAVLARARVAQAPPAPFFPQGGAHWNARATWLVANQLQAQWQAQGLPLEPLRVAESHLTEQPQQEDDDLARLLNLATPLRYPCEQLSLDRVIKTADTPKRMALVGDSFSWQLARLLSQSGQFSEIDVHFYYRLYQSRVVQGEIIRGPDGPPQDFAREILGADCLLLELNEASAPTAGHYLDIFLQDALAHLPTPPGVAD